MSAGPTAVLSKQLRISGRFGAKASFGRIAASQNLPSQDGAFSCHAYRIMDARRQAVVSNLELCLAESLEALGRGAEADLIAGLAKRLEAMAFELCIPGVDDAGYEELNESGLCWAA